MKNSSKNASAHLGKIIIPAGLHPWPHELHTAEALANSGYIVEFLLPSHLKKADILLNGIEYEIKSPKTSLSNSLEHIIKKALKQSLNIIIDSVRMKPQQEAKLRSFLIAQTRMRKQIKKMILITKRGQVIDIV